MIKRLCRRTRLSVLAGVAALLMIQGNGHSALPANTGIDPLDVLKLEIKPNVLVLFDTTTSMYFGVDAQPGFRRLPVGPDDPMSRTYQAKQALAQVVRETKDKVNFGIVTFQPDDDNIVSCSGTPKVCSNNKNKTCNKASDCNLTGNAARSIDGPHWDADGVADEDGDPAAGANGGGKYDGPFMYVTADRNAHRWHADRDGDGTFEVSDMVDCRGDANSATDTDVLGGQPTTNMTYGWFCDIRDTTADWDAALSTAAAAPTNTQSQETFRSFGNRGVHAFPYPESSSSAKYDTGTTLQLGTTPSFVRSPTTDPSGPAAPPYYSWLSGLSLEVCIEGTPNVGTDESTPANNPEKCRFHPPVVPASCPAGEVCRFRYYMQSRYVRHGLRYLWDPNEVDPAAKLKKVESFTCPNPPGGLLGFEPDPDNDGDYAEHYGADGRTSEARPCFAFAEYDSDTLTARTGTEAIYYYTSAFWGSGTGCEDSPMLTVETVTPCGDAARVAANGESVLKSMRPAGGKITVSSGQPVVPGVTSNPAASIADQRNFNPTTVTGTTVDAILGPDTGLRAGGSRPIGAMFRQIRTQTTPYVFPTPNPTPPAAPRQKNYILVVTDGQDNCMRPDTGSTAYCCPAGDPNRAACECQWSGAPLESDSQQDIASRMVAHQAHLLWKNQYDPDGPLPAQSAPAARLGAELLYVAFTSDANAAYANRVARAGSGGDTTNVMTMASSDVLPCLPGGSCRDAFIARTKEELVEQLRLALKYATTADEYSAQQVGTVVESIFELGGLVDTDPGPTARYADPLDPDTRYTSTFPLVLQSTFYMPGFQGRLKAFKAGSSVPVWEAGQKLLDRIVNGVPGSPGMGSTRHTFAALAGGDPIAGLLKPTSGAKLQRRIFTTESNGAAPDNVPLWPPTTTGAGAVAPTSLAAGRFDRELGIDTMTLADLQAEFQACLGTLPPGPPVHPCADPAQQLDQARKEAREMILAFTAGAKVAMDATGPARDASGELLYEARSWVLVESTLSTPAIVGPPPQMETVEHRNEWVLYRDGPRDGNNRLITTPHPLEEGFGLRRPDRLDPTATSDPDLKPVMTVAYMGTNHLLHAFRAGPQRCSTPGACPGTGNNLESGGEELWAFCPYELLPNLRRLMKPQGILLNDHTFMIASSIRFGDVFFPGTYTDPSGTSQAGKWRTVMVFGRGAGGKHLTAMDITGRGPFTRPSLDTKLPVVLWNRGNPDIRQYVIGGSTTGTSNATGDDGHNDGLGYAKMAETWSVGALAPLSSSAPARANYGAEWVYWVGSGFSDVSTEGQSLFMIDVRDGDILYTADVPARATAPRRNSLVASVATYIPTKLTCADPPANPADGPAETAIIGDTHGRLWKVDAASPSTPVELNDLGVQHPIGVAASVLRLNTDNTVPRMHVYAASGGDDRQAPAPATTPPFKMIGIRDDGPAGMTMLPGFPLSFIERFRGTTQPLVAFGCDGTTMKESFAFFVGTQFNPAGGTSCVSSFDTVVYALKAGNGNEAGFDLSSTGDARYATLRGEKVQNITARDGKVVLDRGVGAESVPSALAPPAEQNPNATASVLTNAIRWGSPLCY